MVRIIIILFLSIQFCYSQISNSQFYFGRGLDSSAILTNDIADSSIIFRKLKYITGPKLIGNPAATYDSIMCIKLGTGLSFSHDTLNAVPGGTGDVHQGGDSYSGDMIIGTNDNNLLALQTNGVYRATITSGATTGGEITTTSTTTNTNTFNNALTIRSISTGTAAAGFGSSILFQGESSTTNHRDMIRLAARWETATDASRGSYLGIETVTAAGAILQRFKFTESGTLSIGSSSQAIYSNSSITTAASFTVGASSNALTLGGSSGTVTASTSSTAASSILISSSGGGIVLHSSASSASSTATIDLGNSNIYNQTSGTRNATTFSTSFSPTSGTAVHNGLIFSGTFNQTGGANGITRNIYLNPTLTAVADFRGIESTYNTANAWHLYQTGSSSKGNTLLKTSIGTTTAPTSLLMLAAGTASANTAPLKFTSGTNLTTPEAGAVEYDASNLYITNGSAIRFTIAKMLSGSATLDFGNTAAGTSDDLTVTITGAADGDEVVLGVPNAAMNASSSYFAWVSATNTITIRHNNYSTGAINPASATFKVSVIKR